jgi:hypothetical protein
LITGELVPFVSEVRSLSVRACGGGACRCMRCMRARRSVYAMQENYFPGVRVPARKCPPLHVRVESYIYIKEARDKIQGFRKV